MINTKLGVMLTVAFIAGAFVASPELRAYAAATIGSAEIIDNSIRTVDIGNGQVRTIDIATGAVSSDKIKDSDVKAPDIATDAVGADELSGVSKLIFAECILNLGSSKIPAGSAFATICTVPGADTDDNVFESHNSASLCFPISRTRVVDDNTVSIGLVNACNIAESFGSARISIIVYDP